MLALCRVKLDCIAPSEKSVGHDDVIVVLLAFCINLTAPHVDTSAIALQKLLKQLLYICLITASKSVRQFRYNPVISDPPCSSQEGVCKIRSAVLLIGITYKTRSGNSYVTDMYKREWRTSLNILLSNHPPNCIPALIMIVCVAMIVQACNATRSYPWYLSSTNSQLSKREV